MLGDRDELVRMFENLIENALKYGAAGKRVDIKLGPVTATKVSRDASQRARLRAGYRAEHLPRLTERFYRVDVRESRTKAAPDSAWRWSSTFSTAIAAGCRSRACRSGRNLYDLPAHC